MISGRRRSVIFFTVLGICLVAVAVTLNVGWVVISWQQGVLAVLGIIFFLVIIAGLVLNTIFLVREIRRNEQHDSFINAVTHELKTPVASIRLYLQTLQTRELDEAKRREFYRIMLEDSDRLLNTIEQVLRAGSVSSPPPARRRVRASTSPKWRASASSSPARASALAPTRWPTTNALSRRARNRVRRRRRVEGRGLEPDRQRREVLAERGRRSASCSRKPTTIGSRCGSLDRGVGISPGELKRVFRRFYRVPTAVAVRARGSSGLGSLHRPLGGAAARRAGVRGERRGRPRQHVHAAAARAPPKHERHRPRS